MPNRKYFFNIDKIKNESHEKYYWLGFISGDGSIQEQGRRLRIEIQQNDIELLNNFKEFLECNSEITFRVNNNNSKCCKIDINSSELGRYLAEYNIVPNKTQNFSVPVDKIPKEYIYDYIRGYMDADGSIHIRKSNGLGSLSFSCHTEQPLIFIKDTFGIANKISKVNNNFFLNKEGKDVLDILNKIYENSTEKTRLNRKYQLYCTLVK